MPVKVRSAVRLGEVSSRSRAEGAARGRRRGALAAKATSKAFRSEVRRFHGAEGPCLLLGSHAVANYKRCELPTPMYARGGDAVWHSLTAHSMPMWFIQPF